MNPIADLRTFRTVLTLIFFAIIVLGLYIAPFLSGDGPIQYLMGRPKWSMFIVPAWIFGGPLILYVVFPLLRCLLVGRRHGLFVEADRLVFLSSKRFSVELSRIIGVEIVSKGGAFMQTFLKISISNSKAKYLPLLLLEGDPETLRDKVVGEAKRAAGSIDRV